jgi:membrane protein DedA with SNARE-associated domain
MTEWLDSYGLVVLFAILAVQSAGIPGPPGKTALVAAAILAARGHFSISGVIAAATAGIVLGGFVGYAAGRIGGRRLLQRPFVARRVGGVFERAERFFDAHGGKAVFTARFLPGLKVAAAPAAGVCGMGLPGFALWHVAAAVAFSAGFGLAAFFVGEGAVELVEAFGVYGFLVAAVSALLAWLAYDRLWLRRRRRTAVSTL